MVVVVTGAARGLGLSLTRASLAAGHRVRAGVRVVPGGSALDELQGRHDDGLVVEQLDVIDEHSVASFARRTDEPVDVLIHNAGVRRRPDDLRSFDARAAADDFATNAVSAVGLTIALLPHLRRSRRAVVVAMSSDLASSASGGGGAYGYRMSKAALGAAVRSMAHDLSGDGICVVALTPGWVRIDMGGPDAPQDTDAVARQIVSTVADLDVSRSGRLVDVHGQPLPW